MNEAHPDVSERRVCLVLRVARASVRRPSPHPRRAIEVSETLAAQLHTLIEQHPTYGYRRLWALLRFGQRYSVNRKAVYRILRVKQWLVHQRRRTARPRAQRLRSRAPQSNHRWAMDVTHVPCGRDGWGHLAAVIDCHDREIVGYEFALRGRAREAERALETACLARFGTLRPKGVTPVLRSDNGLIFQSRRFRQACRDYQLSQEFITPYTPEQNGLIERFFRSLKEECVWQQQFESFEEGQKAINRWIRWYNEGRPHQALQYRSPRQYRNEQRSQVA
ncbi:MAG: IS3 family transposase [Nitrospirales bacterium]|nr:IS3 family transposase [Nitrospirales bacterium]NKB80692.1 IS3 family transposase [Nitrospirales bacterium]NKB80721.1 IS3 family transposase [Nitrospirales bacterium]NKB82001.1 IS3 family transposase [Nitrospirales bacterium]NKB82340.1 IS3 family transposase [Nitrospirales bacterium]